MSNTETVDIILDRLHHTFCKYPAALRSALEVIGRSPLEAIEYSQAILANHDTAGPNYSHFLRELAYQPLNQELAVLVRAIHKAMTIFSMRDCRVPTREEVLVGLFRGTISDALSSYNRFMKRDNRLRRETQLFSVDLNVKGREGRTGGDIAFIIDVILPNERRTIVPICLQAKRAAPKYGETVDISRANGTDEVGTHQLEQLEKFAAVGCNCAYLFFNNHLREVINDPVLPLVKTTSDVRAGTSPLSVDLRADSIDFSSYLLHLLSSRENAVDTPAELEKIVASLAEGKSSHLVLISSDPSAWQLVKSFMRRKKQFYSEPSMVDERGVVDFASAFSQDNSFAPRSEVSAPSFIPRTRKI